VRGGGHAWKCDDAADDAAADDADDASALHRVHFRGRSPR
jgi:hypothetical protein